MNDHSAEPTIETIYEHEEGGSAVRVQRVEDQLVVSCERQTPAGLRQVAHWLAAEESEQFAQAVARDGLLQGVGKLLAPGYRQTAPENVSLRS